MKFVLWTLLCLVALPLLGSAQHRGAEKTAAELMQLERRWVAVSLKPDRDWLEHFFADEFISTHPTSGTIKDKAREIADTMEEGQTPDSMSLGPMKVIVAGNTAIVTGSSFEVGGVHKLKDRRRGYLFTDTFIRRGGRWQLLASHSSRIPDKDQ